MSTLLDQAIKIGKEMDQSETRLAQLERDIEAAEKRLSIVTREAETAASTILKEANDQATLRLRAVEAKEHILTQREEDVASRENAVAWVDAKTEELKQREVQLEMREKELVELRSLASAEKDRWLERQKELDAREFSVNEREHRLST